MKWMAWLMNRIPFLRAIQREQARRDDRANQLDPRVNRAVDRAEKLAEQYRQTQAALRR